MQLERSPICILNFTNENPQMESCHLGKFLSQKSCHKKFAVATTFESKVQFIIGLAFLSSSIEGVDHDGVVAGFVE